MSSFLFIAFISLLFFLMAGGVILGEKEQDEKIYLSVAGTVFGLISAKMAYDKFKTNKSVPVITDDDSQ